ncbi:TPA: long polar fimbrial protein LpfD [Enterobacter bugandensis]|uniref:long polar fimbrial protein LpfD n=1 Tax=Enterobacter TaxID=547 RepID=UPI0005EC7A65|nr:long polar fimbrial protein LpfD [Enterobacter bugandensis]KJN34808.1 long polar fimbrial protein LpfD [Enterobacter bugandensis]MCK1125148.1 long polar fimbrial protein LpfD [Enterobacter bugandensis]HAS1309934.1 long polar fimbrial protein LpfD [Enterobacter bugandensis]HBM7585390.1 long polar fimbrial protein LpfD [Enterobacter bugandensis]HBM7619635.1 long polar fimbrial protein LpfD [Enterobacter bugandensis]
MLKKLITIAGLLGGSALFAGQAMAAADWGPCSPNGGTHEFSANISQTITDTSRNVSGSIFPDFYSWSLSGGYQATCECPPGTEGMAIYYSAKSPLTPGHTEGTDQYYVVNNNIQINAKIWVAGGHGLSAVPFTNLDVLAGNGRGACDVDGAPLTFVTGATGAMSLYINKPFVGQLDIPSTKIAELYASKKANVYGSTPMASVYLSGQITVPQGCELSSGSTLEIPFGEFKASDFKDRKGQIAKNATIFTKELQFKCTNISDGVKIFLHIEGMPNANDSNAIDMGNPDIGAVIKGENGKILVPNDINANQELSVTTLVDETHRTASAKISAYPISTTGKLPAAGEFEGIATMRIDVE